MKYKKKMAIFVTLCILIIYSLLLVFFPQESYSFDGKTTIQSDKEVITPIGDPTNAYDIWNAPLQSFGIQTMKTVNWSFFKNKFQNHFYKDCMYKRYSYSPWQNGNSYVNIDKTWNATGFWKINITLDVPVDIYEVNISFGCDLPVLDYIEREGFEIWLNYTANETETYHCFFNWSDIANIPGLTISKHKSDGIFWIELHRNNVPSGFFVFDPTFGYTSGEEGDWIDCIDNVGGGYFQMGGTDGTADNITAYWYGGNNVQSAKCCLYDSSKNLIANGVTDEENIEQGFAWGWVTYDFSGDKPTLTADAWYYICAYSEDEFGTDYFLLGYADSGGSGAFDDNSESYDTFPNPFTANVVDNDGKVSIYCSYTESVANDCPWGSYPSPANNSVSQSIESNFNITITDNESNTWGNISISRLANTSNWSNQGNGSQSLDLPTLAWNSQYTVWVNYSDSGEECIMTDEYFFTTEDHPANYSNTCPTSSNPVPANGTTNVDIDIGQFTVLINDTNGNNTWGNLTCSNGNTSSWSNQANGTRTLEINTTLSYSTSYTVWVNFSDDYGCNVNDFFTFTTEATPYSNTCPTSNNPSPTNNSVSQSRTIGQWNVTTEDANGNNTYGNISISRLSNTTSWSNQANGSRTLELNVTLAYNSKYTVWVNFSDTYGCSVYDVYYFTTEDHGGNYSNTCPTSNNPVPTNNSVDQSRESNFNVTVEDANGNNTWGNISISRLSNTSSWSNQANGSRTLDLPTLAWNSQYTVWVNYSDDYGCDVYDTYIFTTEDHAGNYSNNCPTSNNPSPTNNSVDQSVTIGQWNVTTEDANGNNTWGNISISRLANTSSWSNQANGSRVLELNVTLAWNSQYKVWVNFSDDYGCDKNDTYYFTTIDHPANYSNTCPVSSNPTITNGSTDVSITVGYFNITINDANGNNTWGNMSINNNESNTSSWSNQANGTRSLEINATLNYSQVYRVWVNYSDDYGCNVTDWFTFTTESSLVITITSPYPSDEEGSAPLQPTIYATINSTTGLTMNVSWYWGTSSGNENTLIGTDTNFTNSSQTELFFEANTRVTEYFWRACANDGTNYQNESFSFTTEGYPIAPRPFNTGLIGVAILFGGIGITLFLMVGKKKEKKKYEEENIYYYEEMEDY